MADLELKYPLNKVKQLIRKWLYIEDDAIIDVILATYVANQFEAEPLWMIILGPPSNSKTELLRALGEHERTYFLSNLTPATFVSGKKEGKKEVSLLPKLDGKILVVKDFGTVLSMRSEAQQEILAQLREIYDGKYSKDFGTGKRFSWEGHMGFLAACTPAFDKHHAVISALGDRFLLYRTRIEDNNKMGHQARAIVGQETTMRKEIQESVHAFINQFNQPASRKFTRNEDTENLIVNLACWCAYARCPVERDYRDQNVLYIPQPEGSARIVKQFTELGMGLALIHGKTSIDTGIYELLKKVGRDLTTEMRLNILRCLWEKKAVEFMKEWAKTKDVAEECNIPVKTTLLHLENFMIIGMMNRKVDGEGERASYRWQLNSTAEKLTTDAEIFKRTAEVPF